MNPFYLPPEPQRQDNTFAQILAGLKLGLDAYSTYQTGAIADRRVNLDEQEQVMRGQAAYDTEQYRMKDLELRGRQVGADERRVGAAESANRLKAGEDPELKNFGAVSGTMASNHLQKLGLKKNSPILQGIQEMVKNPDVNNGEAYRMLLQNYPVMREELINSFAESYASKLDKTQGTHADTPEGKEQIAAIEALESDETGEKFLSRYFPGTQEAIKQKAENSKAELQAARLEGQQGMLDARLKSAADIQSAKQDAFLQTVDAKIAAAKEIASGRNQSQSEIATLRAKSAGEIAAERSKSAADIAAARNETQKAIQESKNVKGPTPTEQRMTAKSIADAEAKILGNKSSEAAQGEVDFFNQYATKPYTYVWKPGTLYGGDWTKVSLPKLNGRQVTAKDIWDNAEKYGKTYEEVLQDILKLKGK